MCGNWVFVLQGKDAATSPTVFLSYQWGKQIEVKALYDRLNGLGYSVWMDIFQMGGGDSLYDKIDRGLRGCKVVVTCVTPKYSLSANCRREVSLADALKKPIVPLLLEQMKWPPDGPMSMVFTELLYINMCKDPDVQKTWTGPKFDELAMKLEEQTGGTTVAPMVKEPIAGKTEVKVEDKPVIKKSPESKAASGKDHVSTTSTEQKSKSSTTSTEQKSKSCIIL